MSVALKRTKLRFVHQVDLLFAPRQIVWTALFSTTHCDNSRKDFTMRSLIARDQRVRDLEIARKILPSLLRRWQQREPNLRARFDEKFCVPAWHAVVLRRAHILKQRDVFTACLGVCDDQLHWLLRRLGVSGAEHFQALFSALFTNVYRFSANTRGKVAEFSAKLLIKSALS
jgi:hypothetical protein